jgi:hypothetical protein
MLQIQLNHLHFFLDTIHASVKDTLKACDEKHGTETLKEE